MHLINEIDANCSNWQLVVKKFKRDRLETKLTNAKQDCYGQCVYDVYFFFGALLFIATKQNKMRDKTK